MSLSLLGRLIDIEWLLEQDRSRSEDELRQHDRRLLGEQPPANFEKVEQTLTRWVEGRRRELDGVTLGVRISEGLVVVHTVLLLASLGAGGGAARALLHGASAREPTNLLHFLFATLGWPLALLLGSALGLLLRARLGRSVLAFDMYGLALRAVARLSRSGAREDWDLASEWRKLRRAGRRYRDLELYTLISTAQWYPLAFHLGAALTLLGSALFSDLAFGWSTTNASVSPEALARFFGAVTWPWCAPFDIGCVSVELVRVTQFSRFSGEYLLPEGARVSGAWWPALLACLLVYGVLPRLLLSLGTRAVVARRSACLSERVLELRGRLRAGVNVVPTRSHPEPDGAQAAPPALEPPARTHLPEARPCWVIRWRGAELDAAGEALLCARLGLRPVRREAAGGSNFAEDDALLASAEASADAVLLAVEGWEAPDKATRRFVRALRGDAGLGRPVFVCVLVSPGAAEAQLELWRDRLRLLEDPGVVVERHDAAPGAAATTAGASVEDTP